MSTGQTTSTQISAPLTEIYNRVLLENLWPLLLYKKFAAPPMKITKGEGSLTGKWRRYGKIAANTSAILVEGVTPEPTQWSKTDYTATAVQRGDWSELTDVVDLVNIDPVLTILTKMHAEAAADMLDQLCRDVIMLGTSVLYSSADAGRAAVAHLLTAGDLEKASRTLKRNNVPYITQMVNASTGVGTVPIRPAYIGIVHPDVAFSLRTQSSAFPGFVSVEKYGGNTTLLPGEVGSFNDIRILESTNAKMLAGESGVVGAGGTTYKNTASFYDVYLTLVFGEGAFGGLSVGSSEPEVIIKPIGSAGAADPLNQRGSTGWKIWSIDKILDDSRMVRIETAAAL